MRKLFFFLSLLFAVGTAGAQGVTDLSELSNNKIYNIKVVRGDGKFMKAGTDKLESSSTADDDCKFAIIKLPENNLYYLYSVSQNKFVTKLTGSDNAVYTDAPSFRHAFTIGQTSNTDYPWNFVHRGTGDKINFNGSNFVIDWWQSEDDGNRFSFIDTETTLADDVAKAAVAMAEASYLPFTTTTITDGQFADDTKWYALDCRNYGGSKQNVRIDGTNSTVFYGENIRTLAATQLFCFVKGDSYSQVKVYSLASGADKPLSLSSTNDATAAGFNGDTYSQFVVKSNTQENNHSHNGFALTIPESNLALNWYGQGSQLKAWNNSWADGSEINDQGSCIWEVSADDMIAAAVFMEASENRVGGYRNVSADYVNAQAAYRSSVTADNLKALCDSYAPNDWEQITLTEGMPYNIHFDRQISYEDMYATHLDPSADATGAINTENLVVEARNDNKSLSAMWFIKADSEGKYNLLNVNTGDYGMGVPLGGESCGTKLKNESLAQWEIQDGNNSAQKQLHCANITEDDLETYYQYMNLGWQKDILRYYGNDGGGWLYIEEVPSIEVAISEAKYATLNLPFAVSIPSDVKVTYINGIDSQNENTVYLTEQEITGVIPANTPVILYTENPGTKNFDVYLGNDVEAIVGNQLFGTTLERQGMTSGSFYALANGNYGVGLYKANVTEAPANKAYMDAETFNTSEPAALLFWNGGGQTGIENAANSLSNESCTYFDLNGRRVLYPTRGIYVTDKGQKVFIK